MSKFASKQTGLHRWTREWEVQKAPYKHPLPYRYTSRKESQYPFTTHGNVVNDTMYLAMSNAAATNALTIATNAARQKVIERAKGGASAALALTIADWRSSLSMISGALLSLRDKRLRARLYTSKRLSEVYLEGVFGWLPLMQDIYAAHQVLQRSIPISFQKGKGQASLVTSHEGPTARFRVSHDAGCLAGLGLVLTNPNIALLENLGLINPLSVAWDRVPYSFVINWFIPVGAMLNSLTDLLGYAERDPYSTTFLRQVAAGSVYAYNSQAKEYQWGPRWIEKVDVRRSLGVPPHKLPTPALPRPDLMKACIAFALFDSAGDPRARRRGGFSYI